VTRRLSPARGGLRAAWGRPWRLAAADLGLQPEIGSAQMVRARVLAGGPERRWARADIDPFHRRGWGQPEVFA
jgi:hypothetical protein